MFTKSLNRSESRPGSRLPASFQTVHPVPDDHPAQPTDASRIDSKAGRILIVDDNPEMLKLVSKMVAYLGHDTTIAEDAADALYYLSRSHYDLVITDYDMPVMDGYQLADRIKEKYFGTKVVIMTGHCETDVTELLSGPGIVDGLMLKPFTLETLKEKIKLADCPH